MQTDELQQLWKAQDMKLEKVMKLNLHCIEAIQTQKAHSRLTPVLWLRIAEAALHFFIALWLLQYLIANYNSLYLVLSAIALLAYFINAFVSCIRQIVLIRQINLTQDVLSIQVKLTLLQVHNIDYIRSGLLTLPLYMAYPIIGLHALTGVDITQQVDHKWFTAQLWFSALLIPFSIWLYKQTSFRNIDKRWVRSLVMSMAGKRITKALELLKEIETIKAG